MKGHRRAAASSSYVALSLLLATSALAQDRGPPAPHEASDNSDIIVTANRREERLLDVPISVSSVDSRTLDLTNSSAASNVLASLPSVSLSVDSGALLVSVRGIGLISNSGIGEPNVAQYVDGVYQPRATSLNLAFEDLNRVELLRGPQGTLYGRNATGGAINFIPNRPTDAFEGEMEVGLGGYGEKNGRAMISGPLAEDVAARFSGFYSDYHGYAINLLNNKRYGGDESIGGRAQLALTPSSDFRLNATVSYVHVAGDAAGVNTFIRNGAGNHVVDSGPGINPYANLSPLPFGTGQVSRKAFREYFRGDRISKNKQLVAALTAELDIASNATLKSISGYSKNDQRFGLDLGGGAFFSPIRVVPYSSDQNSKSISQELTLQSKFWDDRVDLLMGAYYFREDYNGAVQFNFFGFGGIDADPTMPIAIFDQRTNSKALFFDATVRLVDRLRVLLGARQTWDDVKAKNIAGSSGPCANPNLKLRFKDFSPKLGLQYDVVDDAMVYAQYQQGFKAGGFNASACNNIFDPESLTSYEAGLKFTALNKALTVATSVFYYDYTNQQVQQIFNSIEVQTTNAGASKIKGGEIEVTARPLAGLQLEARASILDGKYDKFTTADPLGLQPGLLDLKGNRLVRAPKLNAAIAGQQKIRLSPSISATLRAEYQYQSKVYFSALNRPAESQSGYGLVNLYATLDLPSEFRVKAFVRNLSDKRYYNGAALQPVFASDPTQVNNLPLVVGFGAPRTWGLGIAKRF